MRDLAALYDGRPAGQAAFLAQPMRASACGTDFWPSLMAWRWTSPARHPRGLIWPRSTSTAIAWPPPPVASPQGISAWTKSLGLELAHELAAPCSSPTSLRDLRRGRRDGPPLLAGRELLRQAGIVTTDPDAAIGDPRVDGTCRALAERALAHLRSGRSAAALATARPRAAEADGSCLSHDVADMLAQGWPRRAIACASAKPRLLWIVVRCILLG